MAAVAYGTARVPLPASAAAQLESRKGPFARFMDVLVDSRLQSAERELERHAHMLPRPFKSKPCRNRFPVSG